LRTDISFHLEASVAYLVGSAAYVGIAMVSFYRFWDRLITQWLDNYSSRQC